MNNDVGWLLDEDTINRYIPPPANRSSGSKKLAKYQSKHLLQSYSVGKGLLSFLNPLSAQPGGSNIQRYFQRIYFFKKIFGKYYTIYGK